MPGRPVLTMFIWADGAYFDSIINDYQNIPHFIVPLNPTPSSCAEAGSRLCANAPNKSEGDDDTILSPLGNVTDVNLVEN